MILRSYDKNTYCVHIFCDWRECQIDHVFRILDDPFVHRSKRMGDSYGRQRSYLTCKKEDIVIILIRIDCILRTGCNPKRNLLAINHAHAGKKFATCSKTKESAAHVKECRSVGIGHCLGRALLCCKRHCTVNGECDERICSTSPHRRCGNDGCYFSGVLVLKVRNE